MSVHAWQAWIRWVMARALSGGGGADRGSMLMVGMHDEGRVAVPLNGHGGELANVSGCACWCTGWAAGQAHDAARRVCVWWGGRTDSAFNVIMAHALGARDWTALHLNSRPRQCVKLKLHSSVHAVALVQNKFCEIFLGTC